MERRDRSLEALNKLKYINSLDDEYRAQSLSLWMNDYFSEDYLENISLSNNQMKELLELFYQNINFLKKHKILLNNEINKNDKIKFFFQ